MSKFIKKLKRKPLIWFNTANYHWCVKCPKCKDVKDLTNRISWEPITHPPTRIRIGCLCGNVITIQDGIVIPDEFIEDGEKFKCADCGGYGKIFPGLHLLDNNCKTCDGEGIVDWIDNIRGGKHG